MIRLCTLIALVSSAAALYTADLLCGPASGQEVGSKQHTLYPATYITHIGVSLESPTHPVVLRWEGDQVGDELKGPFRSCPGAGWGDNDCNDFTESNCRESRCTPKGTFVVTKTTRTLSRTPGCLYATYIDRARGIAIHSSDEVLPYPASAGCVRVDKDVARLIYDNVIIGKTTITVGGTWKQRSESTLQL